MKCKGNNMSMLYMDYKSKHNKLTFQITWLRMQFNPDEHDNNDKIAFCLEVEDGSMLVEK
eukprot:SAG31_NODE_2168_length_6266_cov_11.946976_8_plen_60_part_00